MKEVPSQLSRSKGCLNITIRRGYELTLYTPITVRTNRTHPFFLYQIKESNLNFLGCFVELIDEERSKMGLYREPCTSVERSRKRSLYVTK
jgi:hypothetical protein